MGDVKNNQLTQQQTIKHGFVVIFSSTTPNAKQNGTPDLNSKPAGVSCCELLPVLYPLYALKRCVMAGSLTSSAKHKCLEVGRTPPRARSILTIAASLHATAMAKASPAPSMCNPFPSNADTTFRWPRSVAMTRLWCVGCSPYKLTIVLADVACPYTAATNNALAYSIRENGERSSTTHSCLFSMAKLSAKARSC